MRPSGEGTRTGTPGVYKVTGMDTRQIQGSMTGIPGRYNVPAPGHHTDTKYKDWETRRIQGIRTGMFGRYKVPGLGHQAETRYQDCDTMWTKVLDLVRQADTWKQDWVTRYQGWDTWQMQGTRTGKPDGYKVSGLGN